ncbi:unnamed protein product [Linum tenue]|uniref:Uncharacterized protein n=1 Tax=Linum tenue TaxID=586396 RepID=A0AAV0ILP2_9ROSI|nr:unnamed protein product [Linum tenue]
MATETDEVPVMTVAPEVDAAEPVIDLSIVSVEVGKAREEISDGFTIDGMEVSVVSFVPMLPVQVCNQIVFSGSNDGPDKP